MKKHEIIFSIIKIPLDFFIVFISFFIARQLREVTDLIPNVTLPIQTITTPMLINFAIFGAFLYIFVFAIHGLYSIKLSNSKIKEILDIAWYSVYFFLFFSVFVYFTNGILYSEEIPRLIILFATLFSFIFSSISRFILNETQKYFLQRKLLEKRNIVLISNKSATQNKRIIDDILQANIYTILGYVSDKITKDETAQYLG